MQRTLGLTFLIVVLLALGGVAVASTSGGLRSAGSGQALAASPTPALSPTPLPPVGTGYWHTAGTKVLDAYNRPVRIASVSWPGMDTSYWVPAGLDFQPYAKIMDQVKALGFNTIRISLSNELVERNPIVTQQIQANPQFRGLHALTVLDDIINYAGQIGLKIILNDAHCRAARPTTVSLLDEALWYTKQYPESAWIKDWKTLARRYNGNSALIGFDLRNEPHTNGPGPWNMHAYLFQGATWGPHNGVDNRASDWRLGAQRGGNAALSINPHLLMFVEGIQLYPDSTQPYGIDSYFWSGILTPVRWYPVVFKVKHQLVYEPHDYGPMKYPMPWFKHMTYAGITTVWRKHWSFLLNHSASYAAPVFLGEFGTCTNNPECVDLQKPDNQATWFHFLLRFLRSHPEVGWSFFTLSGTNSNDMPAHNGILNPNWDGISNPALVADLQTIQH